MQKRFRFLFIGLGVASIILGAIFPVGAVEHYASGVEGVEGSSVPPPGFHWRIYNIYASFDKMLDDNGDETAMNFDLKVIASAHRFVFMTKHKILGADYGMDLVIPLTKVDLRIDITPGPGVVVDDSSSNLGDIVVEPFILAWHKPRYDAAIGLAVVAPTGKFGDDPKRVFNGYGYWSGIFTLGGTWFFDEEKSLSASVLTRTIVHTEQKYTDITPGAEFVAEWGVGKTISAANGLLIRPGMAGFGEWQISDDSGDGVNDDRSRKYAIGPEINLFWLPPRLFQANLRALWEFDARNNAEGSQIILTLTKSF